MVYSIWISTWVLFLLFLTFENIEAQCLRNAINERLANRCLLDQIDNKIIPFTTAKIIDRRLKREGYSVGLGLPGNEPKYKFQMFLFPYLAYSNNINGGNPNKPLVLGDLTFSGDKTLVRKSGALIGSQVGGFGRHLYGEGRYIDFDINATLAASPGNTESKEVLSANVCVKQHLRNWRYIDICGGTRFTYTEITDEHTSTLTVDTSKIIKLNPQTYNQIVYKYRYLIEDEFEQNQLSLGIESIHQNGLFSSLEINFGARVNNQLVMRRAIKGSITTPVRTKKMTISAGYIEENGGLLLGYEHNENTFSLGLSYKIMRNVTVNMSYSHTDSSIDYYDSSEPNFSVSFHR